MVEPKALVGNFGAATETFDVRFAIADGYADTVPVTLAAGVTDTVAFSAWQALTVGEFAALCSTMLSGDINPSNDRFVDTVNVVPMQGVAEGQGLPKVFFLDKGRPNPFADRTVIRFGLPRPSRVELVVYSVTGERVRTFAAESRSAGRYQATWNGRDDRDRLVAPGVYYCRFVTDDFSDTKKLIKTR